MVVGSESVVLCLVSGVGVRVHRIFYVGVGTGLGILRFINVGIGVEVLVKMLKL